MEKYYSVKKFWDVKWLTSYSAKWIKLKILIVSKYFFDDAIRDVTILDIAIRIKCIQNTPKL